MLSLAISEATERGSPGLLTAILKRIDRALDEDESKERAPSWVMAAIPPLAETALPEVVETLYRWAEDRRLRDMVFFTLAKLRDSKAIPWLRETVMSDSMAIQTRSIASALLQTHFGDSVGLRHLAPKLAERERDSFQCGYHAFVIAGRERRDRVYLQEVALALQRQPVADHVVTLMFLLRKATHPELVVPVLASRLEDRRPARDLLHKPMRKGRVRDFALYYLASNLWPEDNLGRPPSWWVRKLRSPALRRRVLAALPAQS